MQSYDDLCRLESLAVHNKLHVNVVKIGTVWLMSCVSI
jgi:hypothetical protein